MADTFTVGDTIEVTMWSQDSEQAGLCVFHYRVITAPVGLVKLSAAPGAMFTALSAPFAGCMSLNASVHGFIVKRVRPGIPTIPYFSTSFSIPGTLTGDQLPRQVSGLMTKRTGSPGKSGRGRIYVPFPTEVMSSSAGEPTGPYSTLLGTLRTAMLANVNVVDGINTAILSPAVFSRTLGIDSLMTDITARTHWATQRRRGSLGRSNVSPF